MAAMAPIVSLAAIGAGHGLILVALWLPAGAWPVMTVVGLLGAAIRLAGGVGLAAVVLLIPLAVVADCLAPGRTVPGDEHPSDRS